MSFLSLSPIKNSFTPHTTGGEGVKKEEEEERETSLPRKT
jgi:hypothetical protein